jgi:hypothetical protein
MLGYLHGNITKQLTDQFGRRRREFDADAMRTQAAF